MLAATGEAVGRLVEETGGAGVQSGARGVEPVDRLQRVPGLEGLGDGEAAVVVPPGNVRPKLSAPVPAAVSPLAGEIVTPGVVVVAPKVHPPAGSAPVVVPAGAVTGRPA